MADLEELRERVLQREDARARARRLRLSRERLQPRIDRDRLLLAERQAALDAQRADVERLDRRGLTRMLAAWDGSLDERRARELAEVEEAAERVEEIQARLSTLAVEADQLDGDLAALGDAESPYQEALADLVLAARAGGSGVLAGGSSPGDEEVVAWAEQRQLDITRRAEVAALIPSARALVEHLTRLSGRIEVIAAGVDVTVAAADPHGAFYWADMLGQVRGPLAAADEAVLRVGEEVEASSLPDLALPDLEGFPARSASIYTPLSADALAEQMAQAQAWRTRVVVEAEALLEELLRLREELADA